MKIGTSENARRIRPCRLCGGGMSGYVNRKTGCVFIHGCDECAGATALFEVVDEEEK